MTEPATSDEARQFSGRTAVVTGGASGIGAATCRALAAAGAVVEAWDINADAAAAVGAELGPSTQSARVDVSDSRQVGDAFDRFVDRVGHLDIVVNCAGVDDPETKRRLGEHAAAATPFDITRHLTDEQWRRMIDINLTGSFFVLRAALRHMLPRGSGSVVLIGSQAGVSGVPAYPHYSASKGGVHALSRAVAAEIADRGVRINSIAPGEVDTPMMGRSPAVMTGGKASSAPIGRRGRADEVAALAVFLSSDAATYIVGETVLINGGLLTV